MASRIKEMAESYAHGFQLPSVHARADVMSDYLAGARAVLEEATKIAGPEPDTEEKWFLEKLKALFTEDHEQR